MDNYLRLNQAIAQTGFCSRRKADVLIAAGEVTVNGRVCRDFNTTVDPERDRLAVQGNCLAFKHYTYVALNKPPGYVTTMADEKGRRIVLDLLPEKLRHLKPVGRLDMYSEGLLVMTNDGQLARKLTHPSQHLPKRYEVTIEGALSAEAIHKLKSGIPLEDGKTLPSKVARVRRNKTYTELEIEIIEGRNRQLRRMFDYLGHRVRRLVRLSIGGLQLGDVAPGTWRHLTSQEVSDLLYDEHTDDT